MMPRQRPRAINAEFSSAEGRSETAFKIKNQNLG